MTTSTPSPFICGAPRPPPPPSDERTRSIRLLTSYLIYKQVMGLGILRPQQKTSTHFLDCSSPLEREFFAFTRLLIFCIERILPEKKIPTF